MYAIVKNKRSTDKAYRLCTILHKFQRFATLFSSFHLRYAKILYRLIWVYIKEAFACSQWIKVQIKTLPTNGENRHTITISIWILSHKTVSVNGYPYRK